MRRFTYIVTDKMGIHARPAGALAREARKYSSRVTISAKGASKSAKDVFGLLGMGITRGMEITVSCEGPDEKQAAQELESFMERNL
ncbi:MAG: HPr family phosphocarrier protein [Olegusella sp.]|nr:HPr family phosphocarrier protein [Olegusella sp.]